MTAAPAPQARIKTIAPSAFADPSTPRQPYVRHRFELAPDVARTVRSLPYGFGFDGFGSAVYHRTYSRIMADGVQEAWPDTVLRVVNGVMSIRKDWHMCCRLPWDEPRWQDVAAEMAVAIYQMRFLPPGRGLWAMGTEYVYERGAMALYNCAASCVDAGRMADDVGWIMDALMCGVGVGAETIPTPPPKLQRPSGVPMLYVVPDSREGWVESVVLLIRSYERGTNPIEFDYGLVREAGKPLRGIGGVAAGPEPLRKLHDHIRTTCERYIAGDFGPTRLKADIVNGVGVCVVMGNVRRSAEILIGDPDDPEFWDLKDYSRHPERAAWGWMSNNSVRLRDHHHFEMMPEIARRVRRNGEPGFINQVAMSKFGRFGRDMPDLATLFNPCGEVPLENKETCNLVEAFPTRCRTDEELYRAMEQATLYSSTVALLPTHRPETNRIIARNRRIGVSLSGVAEWVDAIGMAQMTRRCRDGYKRVRAENARLATEAGVPESIRVTAVKPSGSISQLVGCPSGAHRPTFPYAIRRMSVARDNPVARVLDAAGYPHEPSCDEPLRTEVYEFPTCQGPARPATSATIWEQALMLCALQREWADNAVSCTIYFDPEREADDVERVLAAIAPMVKSVSCLPHTEEGAYKQMPYQGITREEYARRIAAIRPIDWEAFRQAGSSDGEDQRYCEGGMCQVPPRGSA